MGRVAATLIVLMIGAAPARADDLAEDFVTAFRLICLSDKPYSEALEEAVSSGKIH